ncbi:hypothetical protein [Enterobacter wuhouensis]|uniref:hypothetical protein n=1 Tax=Enterobacter wuhouensis TaxID=2529381 RepID=UPI0035255F82
MKMFTLKIRVFLLLWSTVMLVLSAGGTYAGLLSLMEYLSFPAVVIFSAGMIALVFSFLIILPLCIAGFYSSTKGIRISEGKGIYLFRWFIYALVSSIVMCFVFKLYYQHELDVRKYIVCDGVPSGWMPGMASKYALEQAMCYKDK